MANVQDQYLNPEHLGWLVRCRSQNQQTSFGLFKLLNENQKQLKRAENNSFATMGISLVAISFSLWRAVFLADRTGKNEDRFQDALSFLRILIGDNAISYPQDKNTREWTFAYYMNNARFRLKGISEAWSEILPNFDNGYELAPRDRWEHYQHNLDLAVGNYGNVLAHELRAKKPKE